MNRYRTRWQRDIAPIEHRHRHAAVCGIKRELRCVDADLHLLDARSRVTCRFEGHGLISRSTQHISLESCHERRARGGLRYCQDRAGNGLFFRPIEEQNEKNRDRQQDEVKSFESLPVRPSNRWSIATHPASASDSSTSMTCRV